MGVLAGSRAERREREVAVITDVGTLDSICAAVAHGDGLIPWCRTLDVRYTSIMQWLVCDPERHSQYELALAARGTTTIAQLEEVIAQTIDGTKDPRICAAIAKPLQWLAGVYDRKRYGEQVRVDVKHSLAEDHLEALKGLVTLHQRSDVTLSRAPAQLAPIDAEFLAIAAPLDLSDLLGNGVATPSVYDV